jgi:hypothetical protein
MGAHVATRFVEGKKDKFLVCTRPDRFAVEGNDILLRINQLPDCGGLAVDADTPFENGLFTTAPGTHPLHGKKLLNPLPLTAFCHESPILANKADGRQAQRRSHFKLRPFARISA